MNSIILKILSKFFNGCNLNNVVFIPAEIRLPTMNLIDYLKDDEVKKYFYNKNIVRKLDNMRIIGTPRNDHVKDFISMPEAKLLIQHIIENSNAEESADYYIELFKREN